MSANNITRTIISVITLLCLLVSANNAISATPENQIQQVQPPVINFYPDITSSYFINSEMLFLEDPEHTESIDTIINQDQKWNKIDRNSPNFGFTATAYWFKFYINNTSETTQSVYLELPIPFLDSIHLYQTSEKTIIQSYDVGDQYPFEHRPIIHQNYVMPFELIPGINEMYMRVSSAGSVEAPLTLWTPKAHAQASSDNNLVQGIWVGIIGIMVVYNFLLFLSIRDTGYLYYVFFSIGYLLFQISLKGYGFAYLWPNELHFNSYAISTFIAISNLSVLMLVIKFLSLKKRSPRVHNLVLGLAVTAGLLFLSTFFVPYSITIRATSLMTMFTCSLSLILGYVSLYKGYEEARYYCLAWTACFIGISILGAAKFGLVTANFWTNNAGQIGVMTLVALLSFALANRINREKEMRLSAQNKVLLSEQFARQSQSELLKAQTDANNQLEEKVEERTRTMQQALDELEHVNNRLELASITDSLTTLFNRGHFDSRLAIEYKRAVRHHRELSIILCDIDKFKVINDTYGHKAGDDCLRHVSLILKNTITRSGDIIARYGGEEFIILLVDTPIEEATRLAEALCQSLRETSIDAKNQQIKFTASFGVSSLSQTHIDNTDMLVNHADEALYQAKNNGRNQVCVWQPPH